MFRRRGQNCSAAQTFALPKLARSLLIAEQRKNERLLFTAESRRRRKACRAVLGIATAPAAAKPNALPRVHSQRTRPARADLRRNGFDRRIDGQRRKIAAIVDEPQP